MGSVSRTPKVVIVGGGFGGLAACRRLARADAEITLIDRRNHHLFQPLLYQVATAALSPAQIAAPIRKILSRQKNASVILANAERVDTERRIVETDAGEFAYDHLVIAAGATHSYFGNDEWAERAPGLKTVEDALEIRKRYLLAFERASLEADPDARSRHLTFVIVGAGPTGVELAGAMAEIAHTTIRADYRTIDTGEARVVLVEGQGRVLPGFDERQSERAKRDLESLGVEVRLGSLVTELDERGAQLGEDERIETANVFWAAGVRGASIAKTLGVETDKAGRVPVGSDLSVPGMLNVFVVGDLAYAEDPETGEPVPGVAQGALQGGSHVGKIIAHELKHGERSPSARPAFRYRDKGMLATIGRSKAVAEVGGLRLAGTAAWMLWAFVHIWFLIGFRNKLTTMIDWVYTYFFFARGARLITGVDQGDKPGSGQAD